jgi:8-oxo-dGTP pyrophosphatase MutT (NUDIX family)
VSGEAPDLVAATRTAYTHLHADAVAVLSRWPAPDAAQERLRRDYLDHLSAHPDGVAKAGPPAHVTASCLVVDADHERVLLTLHRRARQWFQFGGHLESGDSTVWAAARREAREESGLGSLEPLPHPVQLDRHLLVGDFGRCREHLDVRYVAVAPDGATGRVSEESLDVRWWPVDDLPPGTRKELTPLVSRALRALESA